MAWRPFWTEASPAERAALASIVGAAFAATWYLWPFWREQPELSHGYFALPCALALWWQARLEPNLAARGPAAAWLGAQWLLCLAGTCVVTMTALAALAQGPFHSQTAFLAGLGLSLFLLSAGVALARAPGARVPFNGASLAAVLLWWFAVPLPAGTLSRFTLLLQDMITAGSLRTLHLFGYPAVRHGNVIQMANTLVGVEEACSGIRSLTACLFAGVVLGGLMLRGIFPRLILVVSAGLIAIVSNLFRSVALCIMAARGTEINGFWHDATAYAVLGVTALVLFGGCLLLSPKGAAPAPLPGAAAGAFARRFLAAHATLGTVTALLLVLVFVKTLPGPDAGRPPPDLGRLLSIDAPGWEHRTDEAIFRFSDALNTRHLRQETYRRGDTQLTFYVAFWTADDSTLGSVALHTPEICLPGSGWNSLTAPAPISRYPLPRPQRFAFEKESYPQYVWFWHYFDGQVMERTVSLYPWHLAPLLLKRGISAKAPQWVVRISSNQPLETLLGEPVLQEFIQRLRAAGLAGT